MILIEGERIADEKFPNGETIFKIDSKFFTNIENVITLELVYETNEDIFNLLIIKKYLDEVMQVSSLGRRERIRIVLKANFMPYGQSDREFLFNKDSGEHSILTFKYFSQLINEANFDKVIICDPHSPIMYNSLNNCRVITPVLDFLQINSTNYDLVFFPDNGALKKYCEIFEYNNINIPYTFAYKKRDLATGKIKSLEIVDKEPVKNARILVVDDLIVRGGSYRYSAEALKALGAKQIDLYITHVMPSARDFWTNSYKLYGINNLFTANTLRLPWVDTREPAKSLEFDESANN